MASERRAYSAGVFTNFGPAIASGLRNLANFSGRASRPEFWYFVVFLYFASLFLSLAIIAAIGGSREAVVAGIGGGREDFKTVRTLVASVFALSAISVSARRLHDIGRSGWWQLLSLTIIGYLVLLYWFCKEGDLGANFYGNPRAWRSTFRNEPPV
jgi:uncharacterized membrane protein YhaH (DUF805 family)